MITVICSWCKKYLGRKRGTPQGGPSHGICRECKRAVYKEMGVRQ